MKLSQLKIDPEFQSKIPPLQFEEEQQLMLFCSDQRRSDLEAVLSVGLFVLHKFLEFC